MSTQIDVKKLRKLRGWTQDEMAERFGVVSQTIRRWENDGIPKNGPARAALEMEWTTVSGASA